MKNRIILSMLLVLCACGAPELPENHGKTDGRLYLGAGEKQPLIVGLGGSEGGNAWDSDRWKITRDSFLRQGYAFLALEYFGGPTTPSALDRISIDAVHEEIVKAAQHPGIDSRKIALIGGSKGAELALLLASKFNDITCVVALVPGSVSFPALTFSASTSSWTYKGKEVFYAPMPWAAVPAAIAGDKREAFEIILEDSAAVNKAAIEIEKIQGAILFLSASKDEMWPSSEMSVVMMQRLKDKNFSYPYKHIMIEGGHMEPLKHFDKVHAFLKENFPAADSIIPNKTN